VKEKKFNKLYKYFLTFGTKDTDLFQKAQSAVIESQNPWYCYVFAKLPGADVLALGRVIIQHGDAEINKRYAKHIPGTDIEAHAQVVLDSGDLYQNFKFAKDVPGADVSAHAQVILDSGDARMNEKFAKLGIGKGVNPKAHEKLFRCKETANPEKLKRKVEKIVAK